MTSPAKQPQRPTKCPHCGGTGHVRYHEDRGGEDGGPVDTEAACPYCDPPPPQVIPLPLCAHGRPGGFLCPHCHVVPPSQTEPTWGATLTPPETGRCVGVVAGECPAPLVRCHQGCKYADEAGNPTVGPVKP